MGHMNNVLLFDNRPKLPGVTELKEILPGVTIALSQQTAEQPWGSQVLPSISSALVLSVAGHIQ